MGSALATAVPHKEGGALKATEDGGHDGPVSRSLLRDLLGEIRKTANEQAAEMKELRKELTKTKEELAEKNTNHGLNELARELNKTKADMSKHFPQWSDYHALARVMNSTKDQLAETPNADDFIELRRDVVSRVHNLTREYFVGMPRQADVHMLKRELNKTKQVDKIRMGLEASTVGNKTSTNAQFNGYVSPSSKELDAASDEAARLQ